MNAKPKILSHFHRLEPQICRTQEGHENCKNIKIKTSCDFYGNWVGVPNIFLSFLTLSGFSGVPE